MNKYLNLIISVVFIACNSSNKKDLQNFTIQGTLTHAKDSIQVFAYDTDNQKYLDSTLIINNKFSLKGKIKNPVPIILIFYKKNYSISIPAWVDNQIFNICLNFSKLKKNSENFLENKNILSSQINRTFIQYKAKINAVNSLRKKEVLLLKGNKKKVREVNKRYTSTFYKLDKEFAFTKPNNYISISKMVDLEYVISKDSIRLYYSMLNLKFRNSKKGKQLKNFIDAPILVEGEPIIDFSAKDVNGEEHQLSNYTKGVVLLDFWYSLCGPCRYENVNELPQIANTYKDNDFKLISFSVETNHKLWKNAVEKDKMTWLNLSDLKGTNSEVAIKYNLKFFPTFFIIKNGVIMSRIEGDIEKVKKELVKIVTN